MYRRQDLQDGQITTAEYLRKLEDGLVEQSEHRGDCVSTDTGVHGIRAGYGFLDARIDGRWKCILGSHPVVYGVSIDLTNSNPETAVTYTDDAVGMIPGTNWLTQPIFDTIKPCLFKAGAVVGYLNPNNFAQFEDGTAADITSGDAGDVMIEIPKIGYKIAKAGNILTVQITNDPAKAGFSYLSHTRAKEGDRDFLYIGGFLGSVSPMSNGDSALHSISGRVPLTMVSLSEARDLARAKGTGYDIFSFYPLMLIQCLYLIMYKNLDSQTALGRGHVDATDISLHATGSTLSNGMCFGEQDGSVQMKFLGLEDLWGNMRQWIDGLLSFSTVLRIATEGFNDSGTGYKDLDQLGINKAGFMKVPQGTNLLGFLPNTLGGSDTTYFSDYLGYYQSDPPSAPVFGGALFHSGSAGVFYLNVGYDPPTRDTEIGCRLMYL